jgi:hypothetical protein
MTGARGSAATDREPSALGFDYCLGPDPLTLDSRLERRITWWHWIAETGHRHGSAADSTAATDWRAATQAPPGSRGAA